ncbi:hypothetical protein DM877_23150 [Enterobacter cloacae]|uniref:Uncharacterized protein n=1 Tax=Enterobacter cloacae TaxID=550 RepID=A0A4Q2E2K2_ENTCL|nr:hypothetical protein DM877_23150 [Enterobacter cloacae]
MRFGFVKATVVTLTLLTAAANGNEYTRHTSSCLCVGFLAHLSHVLMYAPEDSLRRRLHATRII